MTQVHLPPNLAQKTLGGMYWVYASRFSGKLLAFLSLLVLTRILTKEEFGVASYATLVIGYFGVLKEFGVGPALIYHRDDPMTAHTAFWLGLGMAMGLGVLAWSVAPWVGMFFNDARAIPVTRYLALSFPLSALATVHERLLHKRLAFRNQFLPSVLQAASKGLLAILLAAFGCGAWSLIIGQLAGTAISVLAYWWVVPWRPALCFAPRAATAMLTYGMGIVAVDVLAMVVDNVDYLLVGRYLGAQQLGLYTVAFRIPELLILQFCGVLSTVLFPVYVTMQHTPEALSRAFLHTLRYVSMVTVGLGVGLAMVAEPFVLTCFTAAWRDIIPVIRAIAIYAMLLSLSYNAGSVYRAQGRSAILTKLALVRVAILLPALWWAVTVSGSLAVIGWTHAVVALLTGILNLVVAGYMLRIPALAMVNALRPSVVGGALMALAIAGVLAHCGSARPLWQLFLTTATGGGVYAVTLWWFQPDLVLSARQAWRAVQVRG
jgi:PST family polysaccharide transporter